MADPFQVDFCYMMVQLNYTMTDEMEKRCERIIFKHEVSDPEFSRVVIWTFSIIFACWWMSIIYKCVECCRDNYYHEEEEEEKNDMEYQKHKENSATITPNP